MVHREETQCVCIMLHLCALSVGAPAALEKGWWIQEVDEHCFHGLTQLCVDMCVRVCLHLGLRLKGMGKQASHRSISFLLWRSGDLRCMASCDPDSFLLSPSAPPHWHSGITSEVGRDEREGEGSKKRMGEGGKRGRMLWIWADHEIERTRGRMGAHYKLEGQFEYYTWELCMKASLEMSNTQKMHQWSDWDNKCTNKGLWRRKKGEITPKFMTQSPKTKCTAGWESRESHRKLTETGVHHPGEWVFSKHTVIM